MGERQVQIGAGAPGNALLVGVAKEVGKLDLRGVFRPVPSN